MKNLKRENDDKMKECGKLLKDKTQNGLWEKIISLNCPLIICGSQLLKLANN
jgi:hypothetical protein